MKVLYIAHSTVMGGATISFFNMISELKKYSIEAVIIIPKKNIDSKNLFIDKAKQLNVKVINATIAPYTYKGLPTIKNPKNFLRTLKWLISFPYRHTKSIHELQRIIETERPDIVHTNVGVIHEGWYVCQKKKIPHVWHLREYQDLDFGYKFYPSKKKFEEELKKSIVISITKDILRHFNILNSQWAFTVYNGIFKEKDAFFCKEKQNYFLVCSRISPEKGHHDIIKAFNIFYRENKNFKLKILGKDDINTPYISNLKKLIQTLECKDKIEFLGYHNDVKPFLREAKALIVASHNEGFGRMTAEACFSGCIVIGRNTAGTKEILDYTGGFQYNGDINDLVEKMNKVVTITEKEYNDLAFQAMEKAKNIYSIEANGENIYKIYNQIISFNKKNEINSL